jgi:hypothetical protein
MKVSGFTFIRNALKYDYPVEEAIRSILPLCDKVYVAVGESEDETLALVSAIDPQKIIIKQTTWDDSLREGGRVLALETDKAFSMIPDDTDWCLYIQADEVIHEKYHKAILNTMQEHQDDQNVEGLLFNYLHFYGSYDYVADSRNWYRKEIRIIRKNIPVHSYRDAQGFRKEGNIKLKVKQVDAWVYHYGWVKPPAAQQAKQMTFHKLWHDEAWMKKNIADVMEFDYSGIDSLTVFEGTHPQVMYGRITQRNWKFSFDPSKKNWGIKMRFLMWIEKKTGWRVGEYKNYRLS